MKSSFIIPTLNRQEDLINCLNSLKMSSVKPDQVILIEQGNLKKTEDAIKQFEGKLNIILLYNKEKSGAKARNKGINYAKGKYIFFIDDDVTLSKKYIQIALEYLDKNKNVIGLTGKDILNQKKPNFIGRFIGLLFNIAVIGDKGVVLRSGHNTNIYYSNHESYIQSMPGCSMILRKECFGSFSFPKNFIKRSFGEDVFLSYQIYKKYGQKSLKYLPQLHFKHHHSSSSRIKNESLIKMKILYRYIFWKNEIYNDNSFNLICYIWSQIGLILLDIFYSKSFKNTCISIKAYKFLIKNYRNIDSNQINFNNYITNK